MTATDPLQRGREAFRHKAWGKAYAHLRAADRLDPLDPEDLERLPTTAYLTGRDDESSVLELEAAQAGFRQLGAVPALDRVTRLLRAASGNGHGLTPRQLQVLGLLATGATNKAIAGELSISHRTVDRHVTDIYDKIGVSSRAAETAYAYEHGLL